MCRAAQRPTRAHTKSTHAHTNSHTQPHLVKVYRGVHVQGGDELLAQPRTPLVPAATAAAAASHSKAKV
jgi:hypothetical protein